MVAIEVKNQMERRYQGETAVRSRENRRVDIGVWGGYAWRSSSSSERYVGILYQDMFVLVKIMIGEDGYTRYSMIILVVLDSPELRQSFFEVVVRGRAIHARVRVADFSSRRRLAICSGE
jgi:hypothetical protein